jgi:hypothetical protein
MGVAQHRRQPVSHVQPDAPNLAQIFGSPSRSRSPSPKRAEHFRTFAFFRPRPREAAGAGQKQTRSSPGTHTEINRNLESIPPTASHPIPSKIPKNFDGPMAFPPCLCNLFSPKLKIFRAMAARPPPPTLDKLQILPASTTSCGAIPSPSSFSTTDHLSLLASSRPPSEHRPHTLEPSIPDGGSQQSRQRQGERAAAVVCRAWHRRQAPGDEEIGRGQQSGAAASADAPPRHHPALRHRPVPASVGRSAGAL